MSDTADAPMWRAVTTVGGWTAISRVLGFARDILLAASLGAGPMADAFFVALKLPNLCRRLFGEGAFSAAFVPEYAGLAATGGAETAGRLAGSLATLMVFGLGAIVVGAEIGMPWLMRGLAPGFVHTPARFTLAVTLTRITFPYALTICLAALVGGMLNGIGRFAAAAAAPVLFNLVGIACLVGLARFLPTPGHAIALGVVLAGGVQLGVLCVAASRAGVALRLRRPLLDAPVRAVLRRMGPGLLGAGVTQVNLAVGVVIASLLPPGTVAVLYYADRVNQLPLGLVGAAVGTALLPALSRNHRRGDTGGAIARLNRAIETAATLALPATVALLVLAHPIMAVLFGRGAFGARAVALSASALMIYAAGLPAIVLSRLLAPACFARGDTATPLRTGVVAVGCNLALGLLLMRPLGTLAPAAAASTAAMVNAALLGGSLWRRGDLRLDRTLLNRLPRLGLAAACMGAMLAALAGLLHPAVARAGPGCWLALGALIAFGLAAFVATGQAIGAFDLRLLRRRGTSGTTPLPHPDTAIPAPLH